MEGITTAVLVILGLFLLYKYLTSGRSENYEIPGPKAYPFVGNALQLKEGETHEQMSQFASTYGNIYHLQIFGTSSIVLNTAELLNKAFCADGYKQIFNDRPAFFTDGVIYFKKNIVFRNAGKLHSDLRKLFAKGLHVYGEGISEFENVICGELGRVIKTIEHHDGDAFEVCELARRSLSNVISILIIGEEATDTDFTYMTDFLLLQDYFANPVNNMTLINFPFLRFAPFYKSTFDKLMAARDHLADRMFYKVKESRVPGKVRGLVDYYLEEQEKEKDRGGAILLTDEVIQANIYDIISAGINTTATVLPNTLLCLVNHPEYQVRVQKELDSVFGRDRTPTVGDRHRCHFLEAVIMESLRYATPVPLVVPHMCSEDTILESYHVNAGTQVLGNIWHIHHDEEIWDEPSVFRPERFLDEDGELLPLSHPTMKSWLAFGTGRRKCPGMSLANSRIFLYLACLLQRWTFHPAPGKCGSCDLDSDSYYCNFFFKAKPFYISAKLR